MKENIFTHSINDRHLIWLATFFALLIFIFDILVPLGVAIGVSYIVIVFLLSFCSNKKAIYIMSTILSFLVILGAFVSLELASSLINVLINRALSILAIWLVTSLVMQHKSAQAKSLKIVESSPNALLVLNEKNKILLANSEAEKIFGYDKEELLGMSSNLLIPTEQENKTLENTDEKSDIGQSDDIFILNRRRKKIAAAIKLQPFNFEGKDYTLASIIDLTESKKAKAETIAHNNELETMLYIISHDLKEPLRSIEYFSSVLSDRYTENLDKKGLDFLSRIINSVERMSKLLDDINLLSKVKKMKRPYEKVDLRIAVDEAITKLQEKIKNSEAKIYIADNLPSLQVNKTWVTEAIYNLVSNALKFTKANETPDIEIESYDKKLKTGEQAIVVRDRGCGVNAEYGKKIFGLFQRAVGEEIDGTGTGLAIVKAVAKQHNGRAWHQERSSGGSEFVISFREENEDE